MSQEEVVHWGGSEWGRTKAGESPPAGALLPSLGPWAEGLAMPVRGPSWSGT